MIIRRYRLAEQARAINKVRPAATGRRQQQWIASTEAIGIIREARVRSLSRSRFRRGQPAESGKTMERPRVAAD